MSLNRNKISLVLLCLFSFCFIYFRIIENKSLEIMFKTLFIISTLFYYLSSVKKVNYIYVTAICFFLAGDLIFFDQNLSNNSTFLGLSAYFLAIFSICLLVTNRVYINFQDKTSFLFILTLIGVLTIIYLLFEDTGFIRIALVFFALSFSLLFALAIYYVIKRKNKESFRLFFGSTFLVSCNVFAALNRFDTQNNYYNTVSGISYVLALFFISNYFILTVKEESYVKTLE